MKKACLLALLVACASTAQTNWLEDLVAAATARAPGFKDLLAQRVTDRNGHAWLWGQDYLFAAQADNSAAVSIDGRPPAALVRLPDSKLFYLAVKMRVGVTHSYQFTADGKPLGARGDLAGYNPDSYPRPGVPKGKLSEKRTITSKIYDGATADYWIYAAPGVDPARPAPLMVWQDGQGLVGDFSSLRLLTVTENLVAQKLIPPMVYVMIAPANDRNGRSIRSVQYDTVSDRYGRYLMEEVLPEVEKTYRLREDGYSRAISGSSSGAICSFNVAWYFNPKFTRVLSAVGSYTALQWRPEEHLDGGNIYPFRVRREPRKNIRVWQSDGSDDIENNAGSWPAQAIQFANSLKMKGYDFHFRFGEAAHNGSQEALDMPESLAWLWRDYDPAKTEQMYEQDPEERDKPLFRIKVVNREAW